MKIRTTNKMLNLLIKNIFPIHSDDFKIINDWSYDVFEKTGRHPNDVMYFEGGFLEYPTNYYHHNLVVLDPVKFENFKKEHLQNLKYKFGEEPVYRLYKHDMDSLLVTICRHMPEKDELVLALKEYISDLSYYWFENHGRQGYTYEQRYRGEHIVEPNDILKERLMLSLISI